MCKLNYEIKEEVILSSTNLVKNEEVKWTHTFLTGGIYCSIKIDIDSIETNN